MRLTGRRLACLLLLVALRPAGAVVLRFQFKPGEKLVYRDQLALAFDSQPPAGPRIQMRLRSDSRIEETVKKAEDGRFQLHIETTENKTRREGPGDATESSENKGDPERVELDERGRVLERKSLGKGDASEGGRGFTSMLDEFAIIQQVLDGLPYPEGEVEPGHRWEETVAVNLTPEDGGKLKTMVDVRIRSEFRRIVLVRGEECAELVSDFEVPLRTPSNDMARELKLSVDGKILGHLVTYFSIPRGRAVVELGTFGAAATVAMTPPGGSETARIRGRLKLNSKTVLEE